MKLTLTTKPKILQEQVSFLNSLWCLILFEKKKLYWIYRHKHISSQLSFFHNMFSSKFSRLKSHQSRCIYPSVLMLVCCQAHPAFITRHHYQAGNCTGLNGSVCKVCPCARYQEIITPPAAVLSLLSRL